MHFSDFPCNLNVWLIPLVVVCTSVVDGHLEKINEEDLLGKVKVTVARSFPDQESLRWGDGNVINEHMDHLQLKQRCRNV